MPEDIESVLFGDRNERLNKALKIYGKTRKDLEQDLLILNEWLKSQRHLPDICCKEFLINTLLIYKFSIEKCKRRIDFHFSLRPILKELFFNKHFRLPHMKTASEIMSYAAMPNFTSEGYRITIAKIVNKNADNFNFYHVISAIFNFLDIRMKTDIMTGDILIIDFQNITFSHVIKTTPVHLKKLVASAEGVYRQTMKQIHLINVPSYVESTISFIRQLCTKVLREKIHVSTTSNIPETFFPKKFLPKEYGGSEYTIQEITEKWRLILDKYGYYIEDLDNLVIDDNKRPQPLYNDEILGFYGNFKRLDVD